MAAKALPSPKLLRKILRYEPETGKLFWRRRPASMFPNASYEGRWNRRYAGAEAFTAHSHGYRQGAIFNVKFPAHRIIWAIVHGKWPHNEIDHINGDRADNRLSNLRIVTHIENLKNQRRRSTNTSGIMGVSWNKRLNTWHASIRVAGKSIHLGFFKDLSAAAAARSAAEAKHGFHTNHGHASCATVRTHP